ncbi:oxygen-binding di-iron domain-containing protein [Fusibacter ferrireducens]|uniref:Stage 0 sporulation protein A homolog n=1 Tax=Fusibacter ferrireducens TaxID=2785058 RepID=A0ABR9ZPG2_9FIRM|nr:response regulator [Fusibacter ferrireducens]MBF4692363.1 response regulator [Fusibacter ferrireducens]
MSYIELKADTFHVGNIEMHNGLDCNPYLLIDGNEAVLFDPGSKLDFEQVLENVVSIVSLDQIKYVVVHHEDPDFCSQIPLLEAVGLKAEVVTTWRTMTLIQYYGIQSPYYLIEEHDNQLTFGNGRVLEFILTPYLHFAGAFASYDRVNKILFSSDLFGAFSYNRTIYADDDYLGKMLTFHEHYMPSNSVLRPVMDTLMFYDIQMILPQHGAIIKTNIKKYIEALRTLECGTLLSPIKKNLMKEGGYLIVFNEVYQRLITLYPPREVREIYDAMKVFALNDQNEVVAYSGDPKEVWQHIFVKIQEVKGMIWLTVIEPFVRNLCVIYDLELPKIMTHSLAEVDAQNRKLIEINQSLDQTIKNVSEKLVKCPVTGLFNERFLMTLLLEELNEEDWRNVGAFICISIDDFSNYKLKYGAKEDEAVLTNMTYMLKETFGEQAVFKLDETDFGLYLKGYDPNDLITLVESFRNAIELSENFLGKLTVSIGAAFAEELELDAISYELTIKNYMEQALNRLRIAKMRGKNYFCYTGGVQQESNQTQKILLVDSDIINLEVLKNFIGELNIEVISASDGTTGLELARLHLPKLIISDIILDKMDGFLLREALQKSSKTKDIDMIYLSHQKDEESVGRALALGVIHYIKKPYLLSELLGIVNKKLKGLME